MADPSYPTSSTSQTADDSTNNTPSYDPAFTDGDAQIILRSSDNVHYRMHVVVLRTTSEVFRDMLTLPKAVDSNGTDTSPEIIPLSEESEVLGTLFRIISGLKFEEWASLEKFKPVLAAAQKYHMEGALDILRRFIPSGPWAEQRPLEVYVIAAQYGWEQIAKIASKHTLALGIREEQHRSMLETISVEYRQRLLDLHRDRRDRFERMVIKASNGGVECFGKSR